jgi:hypothetical protein
MICLRQLEELIEKGAQAMRNDWFVVWTEHE